MKRSGLGPWVRALVLLLVLFPGRAEAQVGRTEITAVEFQGNESFPDDSLALAITSRGTECRSLVFTPFCWAGSDFAVRRFYLRRGQVQRDQLRLRVWYRERGFRETTVDTATVHSEDGTAAIVFDVDEGPPVRARSIEVVGNEGLGYDGLTETLPIQPGDRLSNLALDATRDSLRTRLQNRGHAYADVLRRWTIDSEDPYLADVVFDVFPGPTVRYGAVDVTGVETLSRSTVLNTIQFREGDPYRRDQLIEAQRRLFGLEILRSASVRAELGEVADTVVPVTVTVVEGNAHRVRYGAGWSSAECLAAEASWTSRNFFGGGRSVQVRGRVGNVLTSQFGDLLCWQGGSGEFAELTGLASIDFAQPWIFSTRNRFNASIFGERQSLPDVYVREAVGVDLAITRLLGPTTPLTAFYRPELSRLQAADVLFCSGFLVCSPNDIAILEGANAIAPVGLAFTRTRVNNPINPSRGYTLRLDAEHASALTGSDFRYDRAAGEWTRYWPYDPGVVFATRVRAGWVGVGAFSGLSGTDRVDVVHPQKRFYAGGANSVRGVGQSRLGPSILQVREPSDLLSQIPGRPGCTPADIMDLSCDANSLDESRMTPRPTGGTRVAEANAELRFPMGRNFQGVTFVDVGQLWGDGEDVDLSDLEVTPGVGMRFLSPIGPIRLDVAYRFQGGERLQVVTEQVRLAAPGEDDTFFFGGTEYVFTDQLALLEPLVLYGDSSPLSYRRFQLHISIGQAF